MNDITKDWRYISVKFLDVSYMIENGDENSVNVGLTDVRTELLITLEALEVEYLEVDVKLML